MAESDSATQFDSQTTGSPSPQPTSFPSVQSAEVGGTPKNIDFILDIPMSVTVYVGSTKMAIRDLLQLAQGSVIELDKIAGEPMEVMVNNKLVARGEVVVVNEKFGIRLTDVVSAAERVQHLR
ncbi:MAG: flagellar motor switch protein FliN [Nitrospiraceae bacterium]